MDATQYHGCDLVCSFHRIQGSPCCIPQSVADTLQANDYCPVVTSMEWYLAEGVAIHVSSNLKKGKKFLKKAGNQVQKRVLASTQESRCLRESTKA
jgi:hypothetical protein